MGASAGRIVATVLTAIATAIVIVALSVVPFLSPQWVAFEQGRAEAAAWTGFSESDLHIATSAILSDLVFGPPNFDVEIAGTPVLAERERSHMRDVRGVFAGFAVLAVISAIGLVALYAGARRAGHVERWWRAARDGARGLVLVVIVGGLIAAVAFDAAFELFHRLFFAGGTYLFDPASDRLVQLFPFTFWQETTIVLGVVIVALSIAVSLVASWRLRAAAANAEPSVAAPGTPGPARSEPVS
ncbi:MAG TPA: TIGR01906 family membrane protein [Candidatus Limnocylindrales bacterium]|nr:TIGR01906 family membrane protein [Candidatus Limnocylindrales bacterium]